MPLSLRSDDQLLNEDGGVGGATSASERQQQAQQRNASRGCLLPRFADAGAGDAGSYSNSITSPAQPSPQGPYDLSWLRGASGEASTSGREGLHMQVAPALHCTATIAEQPWTRCAEASSHACAGPVASKGAVHQHWLHARRWR
jgi:hypothetical protein